MSHTPTIQLDTLCHQDEGWVRVKGIIHTIAIITKLTTGLFAPTQGPFSPDRYDLTLCFEFG